MPLNFAPLFSQLQRKAIFRGLKPPSQAVSPTLPTLKFIELAIEIRPF